MQPRDAIAGEIAYRERPGPGPVVVCLHGIGSDATSFDALTAHLPGHWHILAWHAPGYGTSAPLAKDWPVARDYADALAGLLDALDLGRVSLIGHSLGTLMAASFAAAWPERVARTALLACAQGYGIAPGTAMPAKVQARIDDLERLGAPAFAAARAARLVHDPEHHPAVTANVEAAMARVRLPGYAQAVRMLASGDLAADAARLVCPTAVLVGAEDVVTPPAQSRLVHGALPAACRGPLHELEGLGHALHQQGPEAVASCLAAFMEEPCHADG